jgi:hypothetical protein
MTSPHWTARDADLVAPARRDDVLVEELDGEVVFSDPRTTRAFHLNGTAYFVWQRCDGRATTRQIARDLTEAYDVDMDRALDDVEQLVVFFALNGLTRLPEEP